MNEDNALKYLIHFLRNWPPTKYPSYGYDFYLPGVMDCYVRLQNAAIQDHEAELEMREISPHFYSAAWELCRRGIIRPGVRIWREQATPEGSAGDGYSITPFGRQWLAESDLDDFVPTEPGRFAKLLEPFKSLYGPGFHERAQQAVSCYGSHAYLACCAMCGAAAESILLSVACKIESEGKVLSLYRTAGGRHRVENRVLKGAKSQIQREFLNLTSLLKYWRDEAAHGSASRISDDEAYTSLALLLRSAHYVSDHWQDLTGIEK
jgi:hypothetical protein